jgi:transcriptional regulator with XRE-family HTH domain
MCQWRDVGDQVDALLAQYAAGAAQAELAKRHGVDVTTVRAVLRGHGVTVRRSAGETLRRQVDATAEACTGSVHRCTWADRVDVAALLAAYAAGGSRRTLAGSFDLTPNMVGRILQAHGVAPRTRQEQAVRVPLDLDLVDRQLAAGASMRTLARQAGLSHQALSRRLRQHRGPEGTAVPCTRLRHRCPWADRFDVAALLAAYRRGASQRELADACGTTLRTVARILDAHGVARRSSRNQLAGGSRRGLQGSGQVA